MKRAAAPPARPPIQEEAQRYQLILPRGSVGPTTPAAAAAVQRAPAAAEPTKPRRPPTTSSERGKAFRARRRVYKGELQKRLVELRGEIQLLVERKGLLQDRVLQRRESETGSIVRVAREYYTIFQHGMGDRRRALVDAEYARRNSIDIAYKENFLRTVMAEDAVTGDLVGPDASLMQWHFFSASHSHIDVFIERIEVTGPRDDPFVDIHAVMTLVLGPHTLALLFPGAEENEDLVRKFSNRQVEFSVINRLKFQSDGRICYEQVNSNLIEGYRNAGVSMADIAEVMKYAVVSASMTVHEDAAWPLQSQCAPSPLESGSPTKSSIEFVLADADDPDFGQAADVFSPPESPSRCFAYEATTPQSNAWLYGE